MKILLLLFFLLSAGEVVAERPADFASGMTIQTDGQGALYEIEIPPAVYRGVTRADLGDLRVFNGAGEVVPHALRPRVLTVEQLGAAIPLPLFPLYGERNQELENLKVRIEKRADGRIIDIKSSPAASDHTVLRAYLLDATVLQSPIRALRVDWQSPSSNFIGQVTVQGSDDLATWTRLVDNAALAQLEFAGHKVERNLVELRPAKFKYLRLSWTTEQALLASIAVRAVLAPNRIDTPRIWEKISGQSVAGKPGEYSYDLGGHFPVDRVRVELPQVNSLAQLQLFARDQHSDEWRLLRSALVYRLRQGDTEVSSPDIELTTAGERYWLIRVDQKGGGTGGDAADLQIGWVAQKLVFAARGAAPFQLAYGSARVKPAAFAIESIIPGYKTDAEFPVKSAQLSEPVTIAGAAQLRMPWDYKKLSLWASLFVGVALLAWMAYRLARQIAKPVEGQQKSDNAKP
jgi:hypothetical protein